MSWLMRLQGGRAPRPQLAIVGPPMKMIFWHHFKGALSLYFHITSVMSTNGLGQEVNKVRERLAHLDVPAELMRPPPPPPPPRSKPVVTRYLPTARLASHRDEDSSKGGERKNKKHLFFAVNSSDT